MASKEELALLLKRPVCLERNTYQHFYNGGKLRARFVGDSDEGDDYYSEEWIFSTNRAVTPGRDNPPDKGISRIRLRSGEVVRITELLNAFPEETLGKKHVKKFGHTLGLLVKIFDVGKGAHIPVHWHPTPEFSKKHLNNDFGKNEAWMIIGTRPGARAWVGWKEDIDPKDFRKWLDKQDVKKMRSMMHLVRPKVGDVIFLRAGYAHSLDQGICNLEPQEPTDWNILAEWKGYPFGKNDVTCGLKWDDALAAVDYSEMPLDYLNDYVKRKPEKVRAQGSSREDHLVPDEAKPFFDMYRLTVKGKLSMPGNRGFYCAICLKGEGKVKGKFGELPIRRGQSLFVHNSVPGFDFVRDGGEALELVCCYPPVVK